MGGPMERRIVGAARERRMAGIRLAETHDEREALDSLRDELSQVFEGKVGMSLRTLGGKKLGISR